MRMIVAISAAFMLLCTSAATPNDLLMATRYANAAQSLLSLRLSLENPVSRTVVPEPLYLESKALYLKARRPRSAIPQPPQQIKSPQPASSTSLSQRRTVVRLRAREKMIDYYNDGMTWSEAEERVRCEMWREFDALGLACAKHNFHRLRYEK